MVEIYSKVILCRTGRWLWKAPKKTFWKEHQSNTRKQKSVPLDEPMESNYRGRPFGWGSIKWRLTNLFHVRCPFHVPLLFPRWFTVRGPPRDLESVKGRQRATGHSFRGPSNPASPPTLETLRPQLAHFHFHRPILALYVKLNYFSLLGEVNSCSRNQWLLIVKRNLRKSSAPGLGWVHDLSSKIFPCHRLLSEYLA